MVILFPATLLGDQASRTTPEIVSFDTLYLEEKPACCASCEIPVTTIFLAAVALPLTFRKGEEFLMDVELKKLALRILELLVLDEKYFV